MILTWHCYWKYLLHMLISVEFKHMSALPRITLDQIQSICRGQIKGFPYITPCKSCEPQGGAKFDPKAISWALLVEAH